MELRFTVARRGLPRRLVSRAFRVCTLRSYRDYRWTVIAFAYSDTTCCLESACTTSSGDSALFLGLKRAFVANMLSLVVAYSNHCFRCLVSVLSLSNSVSSNNGAHRRLCTGINAPRVLKLDAWSAWSSRLAPRIYKRDAVYLTTRRPFRTHRPHLRSAASWPWLTTSILSLDRNRAS